MTGKDLWLVMYSSGTIGRPKGVMMSHRSIVAQTQNMVPVEPMGPGGRSLAATPLLHVGDGCHMLSGIYARVPSRSPANRTWRRSEIGKPTGHDRIHTSSPGPDLHQLPAR